MSPYHRLWRERPKRKSSSGSHSPEHSALAMSVRRPVTPAKGHRLPVPLQRGKETRKANLDRHRTTERHGDTTQWRLFACPRRGGSASSGRLAKLRCPAFSVCRLAGTLLPQHVCEL